MENGRIVGDRTLSPRINLTTGCTKKFFISGMYVCGFNSVHTAIIFNYVINTNIRSDITVSRTNGYVLGWDDDGVKINQLFFYWGLLRVARTAITLLQLIKSLLNISYGQSIFIKNNLQSRTPCSRPILRRDPISTSK